MSRLGKTAQMGLGLATAAAIGYIIYKGAGAKYKAAYAETLKNAPARRWDTYGSWLSKNYRLGNHPTEFVPVKIQANGMIEKLGPIPPGSEAFNRWFARLPAHWREQAFAYAKDAGVSRARVLGQIYKGQIRHVSHRGVFLSPATVVRNRAIFAGVAGLTLIGTVHLLDRSSKKV